jgi:hypothetical protein
MPLVKGLAAFSHQEFTSHGMTQDVRSLQVEHFNDSPTRTNDHFWAVRV